MDIGSAGPISLHRQKIIRTKIQQMDKPNTKPDIIGAQNEMDGNEVHANQKKETANSGAAIIAISNRSSGGTGCGACLAMARS